VTKRAPSTFGPYLVHEELGTGGMATVHRAELPGVEGFSKMIALKRMLPRIAKNEELVKSFVREAHLASYLHHANLVEIYELGNIDGTYFIAMELITGRSLSEIISRCVYDKPMPVAIALDIVRQICDALDYAHTLADPSGQPLGLIHRDVSPANIIVADTGVVKVIDFGIAKASIEGMQTKSVTVKGKFGYMAPEYIATGQLDSRADLFAVGVVAHELLANQPLFSGGEDVDAVLKLRSMAIPPPSQRNPEVPPDVDDIIMTALARDPEARWQRASAMHDAMRSTVKRHNLGVVPADVVAWLGEMFASDSNFDDTPATEIETPAYSLQTPIPAKILPTSPPPGVAKLPARNAPRAAVVPAPAPVAAPARAPARPSVQIPVPSVQPARPTAAIPARAPAAPAPTAPLLELAPEPAIARTTTPVPPRTLTPAPRAATPLPVRAPSSEPARFTPAPVITRTEEPSRPTPAPVIARAPEPVRTPAPAFVSAANQPTQPQVVQAPPPADDDELPQWTDDTGVETIVRVTDPNQMAALEAAHNAARAASAQTLRPAPVKPSRSDAKTQPAMGAVINPSAHAAHAAHAATVPVMEAVAPQHDLAHHMRELESAPVEAPPPLPIFDTPPPGTLAPAPAPDAAPPVAAGRSRRWLILVAIVLTGAAAGVAVYFLT